MHDDDDDGGDDGDDDEDTCGKNADDGASAILNILFLSFGVQPIDGHFPTIVRATLDSPPSPGQ